MSVYFMTKIKSVAPPSALLSGAHSSRTKTAHTSSETIERVTRARFSRDRFARYTSALGTFEMNIPRAGWTPKTKIINQIGLNNISDRRDICMGTINPSSAIKNSANTISRLPNRQIL